MKTKKKVPILIALGVWGKNGKWEILDWELAEKEDRDGWERLLLRLEGRGVYAERGLEFIIHDGGKGLAAALKFIFPHIPHQRCVFHKLRNIWHAIAIPENSSSGTARKLKTPLIRQAAAIYRAKDEHSAWRLVRQFRQRWFDQQSDVVLTLEGDLEDTLRFYALLKRSPLWRPTSVRTTSLLERVNRKLRRIFRAAGAYHSTQGLLAATARVLNPYLAF